MMAGDIQAQIRQELADSRRILVASHVRPDGDAIGSMLALGLALIDAGKEVQMVLEDGIPSSFRHLEGSQLVRTVVEGQVDLAVTVDCAEIKRVGGLLDQYGQADINIDHHITNENFARINLIEPEAVATASILADRMPAWGLEITPAIASALMTGIITDTLGFRTSNMTPLALRQAADLMEFGVNLPELYMRSLVRRSFQAARYWGAGLSSLQREDNIIHVTLTLEDRKTAGYGGNDDADLINVVSAIDGSAVALIFVEQRDGRVKVSWRAQQAGLDVSRVAQHFGGGGHQAAAGADVQGELEQVKQAVTIATRELLGL